MDEVQWVATLTTFNLMDDFLKNIMNSFVILWSIKFFQKLIVRD